jgi:hypothetical protein
MSQVAWLRYDGYTQQDGTIQVEAMTNDNNDDGYADGETAEWMVTCRNRAEFDRRCGRCRTGISGITVTVSVDGEEVR